METTGLNAIRIARLMLSQNNFIGIFFMGILKLWKNLIREYADNLPVTHRYMSHEGGLRAN